MTEEDISQKVLALWSDDPAKTDLLSFDAVAQTVADALLDDSLDPVALGLSGPWGSGKTTVLNLVASEMTRRSTIKQKILVVQADPWRYDPSTGAKESLIAQVLATLATEIEASATKSEKGEKLLKRLSKRINWAKALKVAATTSVTLQLPGIDDLLDLVKPKGDDEENVRGLDEFRSEFEDLINSEDLKHVRTVVVLVDDLDRCLPETVVDSLEAMRLFLAVPRMSFVIAADEDRVADAIRTRFKTTGTATEDDKDVEDPAHLYLHKIVQTVIPLPALSRFDTQAFLLLLLMQSSATLEQVEALTASCAEVRRTGGSIDDIAAVPGLSIVDELAFTSRLTPLLYEKMQGNPRRMKRFLNDLNVRQSVAGRRGIRLDPGVIAKLMALEVLMPAEFKNVLDWFSKGIMRDQLAKLEIEAGRPASLVSAESATPPSKKEGTTKAKTGKETPASGDFSQAMIRWAKLTPSLQETELSPYLTLAAAFAGITLVDEGLPERLRDIAANLLSSARADQAAVKDVDIDGVGDGDAADLVLHFGRTVRDQPVKQKAAVTAILRVVRRKPTLAKTAAEALLMLPPTEVLIGTPLLFLAADAPEVRDVLRTWRSQVSDGPVSKALDNALAQKVTG